MVEVCLSRKVIKLFCPSMPCTVIPTTTSIRINSIRIGLTKAKEAWRDSRMLAFSCHLATDLGNVSVLKYILYNTLKWINLVAININWAYNSFIGMRYAVAQFKAILYTLVRKFEFTIEPTDDVPSTPAGILFFSQNTAMINVKKLS